MSRVRTFRSSPLPPRERGIELGERLRPEVTATAAAYRQLFETRADRPFDVDDWSERAWVAIQRLAPLAAEEISGIAEGAGRPVREIAAVNARTELLAAANPSGTFTECSAVVSVPGGGRPPVVVQTWDWYASMADHWMHWTIPYEDGRVVETVTEYGMLAKIGVSSAGVAVLLNMLHHENDESPEPLEEERIGYPVHLASRRILEEATTCAEGVAIASAGPSSASTSLTVVDAGGAAASVELFPGGHGVVEPEGGVLVRTNHFISAEGAPGCTAAAIGEGTWLRRDKLVAAFSDRTPTSLDEVIAARHDHADIGGVCAHPDVTTESEIWHATLATVALDPAATALDVTPGGPCAR